MEEQTKRCKHCGEEKPLVDFYHHKYSADKLQVWCKQCFKDRQGALKAKCNRCDKFFNPNRNNNPMDGLCTTCVAYIRYSVY